MSGKMTVVFTGVATSDEIALPNEGKFNVSLSGFGTATVVNERSFDDGVTWFITDTFTSDFSGVASEPMSGVLGRLRATAHSSGTIVGEIGW